MIPPTARPIPSYPGYFVDENGEVFTQRGRRLKSRRETGYPRLTLNGDTVTVHRLVALAFIGKPPPGSLVMHLDDDPTNNHVSNIAYGTVTANVYSAWVNGRIAHGSAKPNAKLTEDDVRAIRAEYAIGSIGMEKLGAKYGVSGMTVRRIVRREKWAHVD